jgi:hypothetical protein
MSFLLLAVGLMTAAVGLVTIGFGIPINAFSLGNTLIISGTIAVATGLILIGLALVLGQLRRIAETLRTKPLPRSAAAESVEAPQVAAPHVPAPMAPAHFQPPMSEPMALEPPPSPRMPVPRAPEPRFPATANEPPGPLDWLRAKTKPSAAAMPAVQPPLPMVEPPMVELTDEAPLSPRPPQRQAMPPMEPSLEPKVWSPNRDAGGRDQATMEPRVAPRAEQPMPRATPQVEPPKDKERFDLVWPDRGSAPSVPAEPKVEARAEPDVEPQIEAKPALEMPLPPIPARPRETRPATERRMPEMPRKPMERGPAILKSGVIDGMPYTLYADGSIEAQLPQGMVKFASVDALRAHLEKQS